jgi:hypothetical protein
MAQSLFLLAALAFWGVPASLYAREVAPGLASNQWIRTSGVILAAQIVGSKPPRITVRYRYAVRGVEHLGTSVRASEPDDLADASDLLAYPKGRTVSVYVNPSHPAQAILERGVQTTSLVFLLLAVAIAAFVSLCTCWEIRRLAER